MNPHLLLLAISSLFWMVDTGETQTRPSDPLHESPPEPIQLLTDYDGPPEGNQDDPGYELYKAGYAFILDEQWEKAVKAFADLTRKYPTSDYLDDAQYWVAYSLMNSAVFDKARDAYRSFLERFPNSSYYDDVVADLTEVESAMQAASGAPKAGPLFTPIPPSLPLEQMRALEEHRRAIETQRQLANELFWGTPHPDSRSMGTDPETQLRMDALNALGEHKEDEAAFLTLKEVMLNEKNPIPLREGALHVLSEFRKFDPLPVYSQLAKTDTSSYMRQLALDYITSFDRSKSVEILIDIFNSIPGHDKNQISRVFYAIAEVGDDKAVDFLGVVAKAHTNLGLRREAIYYLGAIGSDRARALLYDILQGK